MITSLVNASLRSISANVSTSLVLQLTKTPSVSGKLTSFGNFRSAYFYNVSLKLSTTSLYIVRFTVGYELK